MDENDNPPIWLYPRAPDDSRIQVGVDFPVSRIITRVRAVDADIGKNARVAYSLEDASFIHFNNDRKCDLLGLFSIESTSGHLRIREGIRSCIKPGDSIRLLLRATDEGIPPLSKDAEFFLEFKAGTEVLNIPPESTFLTQADEAVGNKPANSESLIRDILTQTNSVNPHFNEENFELLSEKRMHVFVLMIAIPLAATLLCCCLAIALFFVIRSRRRRHPRQKCHKESCEVNELVALQPDFGKNLFSSEHYSNRARSPTASISKMIYSSDKRSLSPLQRPKPSGEHDFGHTIASVHVDDSLSIHSDDMQMDSKVVYPIYLKPLPEEPATSTGETVIRLTSIPELEGTILVPLPKHNIVPCSVTASTVTYQQVPETVSVEFIPKDKQKLI